MKSIISAVLMVLFASLAVAGGLSPEQKDFLHDLKKIGATKSELDTLTILVKTGGPWTEIERRSDSIIRRKLSGISLGQQKVFYDLDEKDRLEYLASGDLDRWIRNRDRKFAEQICKTREGKVLYYSLKNLLTREQLRDFVRQDSAGRVDWLKRYWSDKDPTPTTSRNEWKEEFENRLKFVLDNFRTPFGSKPWDDRGDILLKLGQPEERELSTDLSWKATQESYKGPVVTTEVEFYKTAGEVWTYFVRGEELHFQFEDMRFTGYLTLVPHSSSVDRADNLDYISKFNVQLAEADESQAVYYHDYGGRPLDFAWEVIKFRSLNDLHEVLVNTGIPVDRLGRDSIGNICYDQQIAIRNEKGEIVGRDSSVVVRRVPEVRDHVMIDQKEFFLYPGSYTVALQIRDRAGGRIGLYRDDLFVPAYAHSEPTLALSRAILSSRVIQADSANRDEKFYLNGQLVYPNPAHIFFKDQESDIRAYFEVYNLKPKEDTLRFMTISHVIKYSGGDSAVVFLDTTETVHSGFEPNMMAYQILPLLGSGYYLDPGDYIWRIDVVDLNAPYKTESIVNRLKIKN